jgi:hypothetical protein
MIDIGVEHLAMSPCLSSMILMTGITCPLM